MQGPDLPDPLRTDEHVGGAARMKCGARFLRLAGRGSAGDAFDDIEAEAFRVVHVEVLGLRRVPRSFTGQPPGCRSLEIVRGKPSTEAPESEDRAGRP